MTIKSQQTPELQSFFDVLDFMKTDESSLTLNVGNECLEQFSDNSFMAIEIDHESGIVRCNEGTSELLKCHKNQVGINNSEELEDFVKRAGGIKNAVARMQVLIND